MSLSDAEILERRYFIGASEIAAICGLNDYVEPLDVFLLKKLEGPELIAHSRAISERLSVEIGDAMEPVALAKYSRRYAVKLTRPGRRHHPRFPELAATIDAFDAANDCPVEAKWSASGRAEHWTDEADGVPQYYRPQVDLQIETWGKRFGRVVAIVDGQERHYQVPRTPTLARHWIEQARAFWHDHVLRDDPPAPRSPDAAKRYVAGRYPRPKLEGLRPATPVAIEIATKLADLKGRIGELEKEKKYLEAGLEELVGDAPGIEGVCTWSYIAEARIEATTRRPYRKLDLRRFKAGGRQ